MLLTLAVSSLRSLVRARTSKPPSDDESSLTLLDVPRFAIRELELRGLNVPSSMLTGMSLADLDLLRDAADKEACPCLLLIGDQPLAFGGTPKKAEAAAEQFQRLATAAHRLGCNAMAVSCAGADSEQVFERTAEAVKRAMARIDRLEINALILPTDGLTADPTRLTELIKRIGGFRIGSLPTFAAAAATGDAEAALRKLAPYAGAMHASVSDFDAAGAHPSWDLPACVQAVRSVGYVNTLAIEYAGNGDPATDIDRARTVLSEALEAASS